MKKIIGGLLLSTILAVPALSNAGPAPQACPECPMEAFPKWAGFKLGGQLGYAHGVSKVHGHNSRFGLGSRGFLGGIHLGYDMQFNTRFIVGIEGSANSAEKHLFRYNAAVIARAGYAMQSSLFYVGAGYVGAHFKREGSKKFQSGVRVAVGAGHRINRILLGVEVDYDWFSKKHGHNNRNHNHQSKPRLLTGVVKLSYML
jgi:hypothetical protein